MYGCLCIASLLLPGCVLPDVGIWYRNCNLRSVCFCYKVKDKMATAACVV